MTELGQVSLLITWAAVTGCGQLLDKVTHTSCVPTMLFHVLLLVHAEQAKIAARLLPWRLPTAAAPRQQRSAWRRRTSAHLPTHPTHQGR
jgi:hypothetical protein